MPGLSLHDFEISSKTKIVEAIEISFDELRSHSPRFDNKTIPLVKTPSSVSGNSVMLVTQDDKKR